MDESAFCYENFLQETRIVWCLLNASLEAIFKYIVLDAFAWKPDLPSEVPLRRKVTYAEDS
jgi:hypothetical protein